MNRSVEEIEAAAAAALHSNGFPAATAKSIATRCSWLESVAYPGLKLLAEALQDEHRHLELHKDALGLDLHGISCVFLADDLDEWVKNSGRIFLRNVRHGLYLLPSSVSNNYGIGCPVDPSFALGGERSKNPYAEKRETALRDGVAVDNTVWQSLAR